MQVGAGGGKAEPKRETPRQAVRWSNCLSFVADAPQDNSARSEGAQPSTLGEFPGVIFTLMSPTEQAARLRAQIEGVTHAMVALAALGVSSAGCTSWSRLDQNDVVPARGTVQIWSPDQPMLLRDPRIVGDSLIGHRPLPDTARSAVALTTIDSIRVQTTDVGKSFIVGTGVAIAVLLAYTQGLGGMK